MGFTNLRLVAPLPALQKRLYFIVDIDETKQKARSYYVPYLEALFRKNLKCDLFVRTEKTSEKAFWQVFTENQIDLSKEPELIVKELNKFTTLRVKFDTEVLDESALQELNDSLQTAEQNRRLNKLSLI